jgi:hypothetical protein
MVGKVFIRFHFSHYNMKGFREKSRIATAWLEQTTRKAVSAEAQGFIYASFLGALVGAFSGAVFAFGVGAILF